jgi:hypothetical protein
LGTPEAAEVLLPEFHQYEAKSPAGFSAGLFWYPIILTGQKIARLISIKDP